MYKNEKIGIGLLTCNRKDLFKQQLESILNIDYIDNIVIVKNKDYKYDLNFSNVPKNVSYQNVLEDVGIGYCKNCALKDLVYKSNCDHVFLIEDDIKIKDKDVFKKYIDTAKAFNLQHLIFGAVYTPPSWEIDSIVHSAERDGIGLDMYQNLHGGFVYFTRKCIQYCGLFDEQYINAVEHIDHTYRIIKFGFYTPFWAFADIRGSNAYLEDLQPANPSTINCDRQKTERTIAGFRRFANTWNLNVNQILRPSPDYIDSFLRWRLSHV